MLRERGRKGYTIIEMLVVMVVMGILSMAAMPLAELTVKRIKERELKQSLWEIRHAIDAYKRASEAGHIGTPPGATGYPPSLVVLVAGVPDIADAGSSIYFLRRIPKDPFVTAAKPLWGLRSYVSGAEHPKPGDDVFDVYSTSDEVGMNGIPYRLW